MGILKVSNINPVYSTIAFRLPTRVSRSTDLTITLGSEKRTVEYILEDDEYIDNLRGELASTLFAECGVAIGYTAADTEATDVRLQSLDPNFKAFVLDTIAGLTDQADKPYTGGGYELEKTAHYKGDNIYIPYNNIIKVKKNIDNMELTYGSGGIINKITFTPGTLDTANLTTYDYKTDWDDAAWADGTYTSTFFNRGNELKVLEAAINSAILESQQDKIVDLKYDASQIKATA
jgi:hypothetical protein